MRGVRSRARAWAAAALCLALGLIGGWPRAEPSPRPAAAAPDAPVDPFADLARWRPAFARPSSVPSPPEAPLTPEAVELGRRLFEDMRLSGNGHVSCATCHQPLLSFTDGLARATGLDGRPLARHTPPLWNLGWGLTFFWDGRAKSLEEQALGPIVHPHEMAGDLDRIAAVLQADPPTAALFRDAFPDDPAVSRRTITAALAAFQRTLVSPETRFDRWVAGDESALEREEKAGFALFVGRAGCVSCHRGWRFTDDAFHDIGLPSEDVGRGGALGVPAANHAFKTPSLRERAWTPPYMHDGSLPSLEAVIAHYDHGVVERPTLSADLPRRLGLTAEERDQLLAFLATLSSEDPPRPAGLPARVQVIGAAMGPGVVAREVRQAQRRFTPAHVRLGLREGLTVINDDTRVHNVRIDDPRLPTFSEAQEPGDRVILSFPEPGQYRVTCGIHPDMVLDVTVTPP